MSSRVSLRPLWRAYLKTLRDDNGRMSPSTRFWFWFLPLVAGIATGAGVALGVPVRNGVPQLLAACGLLVGAMLTTFVFLANLRIKINETPTMQHRRVLQRLIGSTVVAALYCSVVALAVTFMLALVAVLPWLTSPNARAVTAAVVAMLLAHLGVTLASVVRRMFGVYYEVFARDFGPALKAQTEDGVRPRSA